MSGQTYEGLYIKYDVSITLPFEDITEKWDTPEEFMKDLSEGKKGLGNGTKILAIATDNQSAIDTEKVVFLMEDYMEMCKKDTRYFYKLTAQDVRDYLESKGRKGIETVRSVVEELAVT
jgi:hypothetical protein